MAEIKENKFQYYLRVFKGASFDKFFKAVDKAHDKSGKSKLICMLDILYSMKRFGAGYNDYCDFEFWTLSMKQRDTYLTRFRSKKLVTYMNDENYAHIFNSKAEFNKVFKDYIGRETIDMTDASDDEIKTQIKNELKESINNSLDSINNNGGKVELSLYKNNNKTTLVRYYQKYSESAWNYNCICYT